MEITAGQYEPVFDFFSFTIATMAAATMAAATIFFWFSRSQVAFAYRTTLTITGLVTFIALYHHIRILDSWDSAYTHVDGVLTQTGVAFNDAYRNVDRLLTVPLLLIELILVMKLTRSETTSKSVRLGALAALMIILGYPGEIASDAGTRWLWWGVTVLPFLWIVYELFIGLKDSIAAQPADVRGLVNGARWLTLISWLFLSRCFRLSNDRPHRWHSLRRCASWLHNCRHSFQSGLWNSCLPNSCMKVRSR